MKVKIDRTVCDGFMTCAKHAPEVFELDDWGYASLAEGLVNGGEVPSGTEPGVRRAVMDCPVHAIEEWGPPAPASEPPAGPE